MKRARFGLLACVLTLGLLAIPRVRCAVRGRGHRPVRYPLGGFRCADCGATGADLDAMGFDNSRVSPVRRLFERKGMRGVRAAAGVRTSEWPAA